MTESTLVLLGIAATIIVGLLALVGMMWNRRASNGGSATDPRTTRGGDVSQASWEHFFEERVAAPLLRELAALRTDHNALASNLTGELKTGFGDMKGAAATTKEVLLDVVEELRAIKRNGGPKT